MQSNIYAQKENGDLRLIAEIEGLSDPALAVDALLDEMPRMKQRQFIVIDLDNVMVVEAGDDIVQPRREITVTNSNGAVVAVEPDEDEEDEEPDEDEPEEDEAPEPSKARQLAGGGHKPGSGVPAAQRRRKPAAKPATKRTRSRAKSTAKSGGSKSAFKANPASAE